jgi:hypothetical protein
MARVYRSQKRVKMADAYVNSKDPEVRGNWGKSADVAGYYRAPRIGDPEVVKLIEDLGGEFRSSAKEVEELDLSDLESSDLSWEEMAGKTRAAFLAVAAGEVRASPGQVAALKEIANRAEGKVGAERQKVDEVSRVILLPTVVEEDVIMLDKEGLEIEND